MPNQNYFDSAYVGSEQTTKRKKWVSTLFICYYPYSTLSISRRNSVLYTGNNEKILLGILKEIKNESDKIQDEVLKSKILSKLDDSIRIIHDSIEGHQGLAVLYLVTTKDIETEVKNPFKDVTTLT